MNEKIHKIIEHIEKNERAFDIVEINYCVGSWWVKLTKGSISSRPAVHKELEHAYAIGLAHYEEAAQQSVHPTGLCPMCKEPLAAAALHEFCYPPATPSG